MNHGAIYENKQLTANFQKSKRTENMKAIGNQETTRIITRPRIGYTQLIHKNIFEKKNNSLICDTCNKK